MTTTTTNITTTNNNNTDNNNILDYNKRSSEQDMQHYCFTSIQLVNTKNRLSRLPWSLVVANRKPCT